MRRPRTWRELAEIVRRAGFRLSHSEHVVCLSAIADNTTVGTVEWWVNDRRTRGRMLRAITEAALAEPR